jgi:hypothetical protein
MHWSTRNCVSNQPGVYSRQAKWVVDRSHAYFAGVEDALKAGNRDGHISINCIYIYSEENPGLTQALKQISNASHGKFKAIAKSDLNR